ncbi:MAG: Ankyrin [Planctomycetaceae bacterium]|nr:Ankyrin [Planctomycetaceae bacterium]
MTPGNPKVFDTGSFHICNDEKRRRYFNGLQYERIGTSRRCMISLLKLHPKLNKLWNSQCGKSRLSLKMWKLLGRSILRIDLNQVTFMWKHPFLQGAMIVAIVGAGCIRSVESADDTQASQKQVSQKNENVNKKDEFGIIPATTPRILIARAIFADDVPQVKALLKEHPELIGYSNDISGNWITEAVTVQNKELIEWFLDQKLDVNFASDNGCSSPLSVAIGRCSESPKGMEIVRLLLERGADPNLKRTRNTIGALNCKQPELRLPLLKLLVKHGVNVNSVFTVFGDKNNLFTALDWASDDCADYLRSVGAKTATELKAAGPAKPEKPAGKKSAAEQVVDYFTREVGPVQMKSLMEIVPAGTPISVHVIPAAKDRPFITLFTTGLSAQKMNVPQVDDAKVKKYLKDYEFAELYIQLPADWKYDRLDDPDLNWPIMQLRRLGKHPHESDSWLGAPATVISRDPVEPLAPNSKFDALLLLPDKKFKNTSGDTVQLYRLVPLYPEERQLEAKSGLPALMRALDKIKTPMIVDMTRKNAATKK